MQKKGITVVFSGTTCTASESVGSVTPLLILEGVLANAKTLLTVCL